MDVDTEKVTPPAAVELLLRSDKIASSACTPGQELDYDTNTTFRILLPTLLCG